MTDNDLTHSRGRWPRTRLGDDDTARAIREIEAEHALDVESCRSVGLTQGTGRILVCAVLAIAALLVIVVIAYSAA